jgi:hypothetical protein
MVESPTRVEKVARREAKAERHARATTISAYRRR